MVSLYFHIPFCERKCPYCDFTSVEGTSLLEDFLHALHGEIDLNAHFGAGADVCSIFFGGGTPSLLTPEQIGSVLSHARSLFRAGSDVEVTMETNPGTVTADSLRLFKEAGVNRLSIGVQSFRDEELRFLRRIHDSSEALECFENARAAGFDNISLDLIFSLPQQTRESWRETLGRAVTLGPEHLSTYSLIVEQDTPLARLVASGIVCPNPPEREAELYEDTMQYLRERGYEQYEVSNFARRGFRSRHNGAYWAHRNYLGYGPSAHSFWREPGARFARRWWNVRGVPEYCGRIARSQAPSASQEILTARELVNERVFLGLRSDGLDIADVEKEFGVNLGAMRGEVIRELTANGHATREGSMLRLTPKGYVVCDEIAARMLP